MGIKSAYAFHKISIKNWRVDESIRSNILSYYISFRSSFIIFLNLISAIFASKYSNR